MSSSSSRTSTLLVGLFFSLLVLLGLLLHRDYGVSWDEPVEHYYGIINIKYITKHLYPAAAEVGQRVPELTTYPDRDHRPIFEIVVPIVSRLFTSDTPQAYLFTRHLLIFGLFVLGTWALYRIARDRFQDWRLGLLAAAALVLSPRFFAESFYNGKDIVFMVAFTVGIYTLLRLIQRPTVSWALLHGLITGLAIDVRILGLMLVPFTLGMLVLEVLFRPRQEAARSAMIGYGFVYLVAAAMCAVIGWPYLWEAPMTNFVSAFQRLSHYPWLMNNFYMGELIPSSNLPWHYAPVWILITTPLPYTLACLVGMVAWVRTILHSGLAALQVRENRLDLLFISWLVGPVLMIIVLNSVLYDGWRHLYFIYPALLLLGVRGVQALYRASQYRRTWHRLVVAATVLAVLEVGHTAVRMVQMHPHQQVYFSVLPAHTAERLFERDYWGLAYRQGLEWILQREPTSQVLISAAKENPVYNNTLIINPEQSNRLHYVPRKTEQYQYYITEYRWHPQSYQDSVGQEVHAIWASGMKILSVFKKR